MFLIFAFRFESLFDKKIHDSNHFTFTFSRKLHNYNNLFLECGFNLKLCFNSYISRSNVVFVLNVALCKVIYLVSYDVSIPRSPSIFGGTLRRRSYMLSHNIHVFNCITSKWSISPPYSISHYPGSLSKLILCSPKDQPTLTMREHSQAWFHSHD